MFSISTLPEVTDAAKLAEAQGIKLELTSLIFIANHGDDVADKIKAGENYKHAYSMHGPFFDLIPCTQDRELRDLIKRRFLRTISVCNELKIKNLVLHSGWFPKTYPDTVWLNNSTLFWTEILDEAQSDINIFIENVYEETPALLHSLVQNIQRSNFGICLDIGHVNANAKTNITGWLETLNSSIRHIHIHNNYGIKDDHYGLPKGTIKFPEVFAEFNAYCPNAHWNLEINSDFEESIRMVKEFKK